MVQQPFPAHPLTQFRLVQHTSSMSADGGGTKVSSTTLKLCKMRRSISVGNYKQNDESYQGVHVTECKEMIDGTKLNNLPVEI
jgi:hypothetical protein